MLTDEAGTAVLESGDTGTTELPSQEPETELTVPEAAETTETEVAETEPEETTETEVESEEIPLAEREDVQALLKDQAAKLEESHRQKEENARAEATRKEQEEAHKRNQEAATQYLNQGAQQHIGNILAKFVERIDGDGMIEGSKKVLTAEDMQRVNEMSQWASFAAVQSSVSALDQFTQAQIEEKFPEYRASRELTSKREQAIQTNDPRKLGESIFDIAVEAVKETELPKLREEVRAEVMKEIEAEKRNSQSKDNESKRKESVAPSGTQSAGQTKAGTPLETFLDTGTSSDDVFAAYEELVGKPYAR